MSTSLTMDAVGTLKALRDQLNRLAGGELDMGGFSTWFKSVRWDAANGFNNDDLAPLGWAIETSLFEYDAFPSEYRYEDLRDAVDAAMTREGLSFPTASVISVRPVKIVIAHPEKSRYLPLAAVYAPKTSGSRLVVDASMSARWTRDISESTGRMTLVSATPVSEAVLESVVPVSEALNRTVSILASAVTAGVSTLIPPRRIRIWGEHQQTQAV